jgi:uncharacterized YigZ family protein
VAFFRFEQTFTLLEFELNKFYSFVCVKERGFTYHTLKQLSTGMYKEKGSKFIALAVPCYSEDDVKFYLEQWRKEHFQSRHLCYAYRLGWKKDRYRANDDGEPNNSAGAPILGQIQSFDLTNVLVGVVRYFGGTKLGVGGLIQAYKTAAYEALNAGEIQICELKRHFNVTVSFTDYVLFMRQVKLLGIDLKSQEITDNYSIEIALSIESTDEFLSFISENKGIKIIDHGIY